jgi:hypothetical protein
VSRTPAIKAKMFETESFFSYLLEMLLGCCLHSYNDFLLNVYFEMYIVYDTGNNLPLVATTPAINMKLRIFPRIFVKIHRGPDGILRGRDEIDS